MRLLIAALALLGFTPTQAEPYLIADRSVSERLYILGISGLSPDGCPSDYTGCSNIAIEGVIDRVGYVDGEDFPNLIRVRDTKTGAIYSIDFPYEKIWDSIGTAEVSWISRWIKPKKRVVIIGIIAGSAGNVTIDSIYEANFLRP
jgi:hypothetical protein